MGLRRFGTPGAPPPCVLALSGPFFRQRGAMPPRTTRGVVEAVVVVPPSVPVGVPTTASGERARPFSPVRVSPAPAGAPSTPKQSSLPSPGSCGLSRIPSKGILDSPQPKSAARPSFQKSTSLGLIFCGSYRHAQPSPSKLVFEDTMAPITKRRLASIPGRNSCRPQKMQTLSSRLGAPKFPSPRVPFSHPFL